MKKKTLLFFLIISFSAILFLTGQGSQADTGTARDTAPAMVQSNPFPADIDPQILNEWGIYALQNAFQKVSAKALPSVVEINVVEVIQQRGLSPYQSQDDLFGQMFPFLFPQGPNQQQPQEREYKKEGLGSGVIIRRDGNTYYAVTNNHVAGQADEINIRLYDGRTFEGKLTGKDARTD